MYINPIIAYVWRQINEAALISYIYDEIHLDESNKSLFKRTRSYHHPMPEYLIEKEDGRAITRMLKRVHTAKNQTECNTNYNYAEFKPVQDRLYLTQPGFHSTLDTSKLKKDKHGLYYMDKNPPYMTVNTIPPYNPTRKSKKHPMASYAWDTAHLGSI